MWPIAPAECLNCCENWLVRLRRKGNVAFSKVLHILCYIYTVREAEWMRRQGGRKTSSALCCVLEDLIPSSIIIISSPLVEFTALSLYQLWKSYPIIKLLFCSRDMSLSFQFEWFLHQNMLHTDMMRRGSTKTAGLNTPTACKEERTTGLSLWTNRSPAPKFEAVYNRVHTRSAYKTIKLHSKSMKASLQDGALFLFCFFGCTSVCSGYSTWDIKHKVDSLDENWR